jgi:SAM-dependent methyltransferase
LLSALKKPDLIELLRCTGCLGALKEVPPTSLVCERCARTFLVNDGVPHFSDVPATVVPDLNAAYVRDRRTWSSWRRKNYEFYAQELGTLPARRLIIELGAGPGFYADLVSRHRYYALDFFAYPGVDVVCNLVEDRAPLASGAFDVTVLSNVLEHLNDPTRVLAESVRLLRPGGVVLITVPFMFKIHQAPYDFYRYTEFMLRQMLEQGGLVLTRIEKVGSILDLLGSVKYEVSRMAYKHTRHPFLLKQLLRMDHYVGRLLQWAFLPKDERILTGGDYFVGYAVVAQKPGGDPGRAPAEGGGVRTGTG